MRNKVTPILCMDKKGVENRCKTSLRQSNIALQSSNHLN